MIKANGWDNHEDTFEETLRRELVAARETVFILQDDIKELTKSYYKILKENEKLKNEQ
tara:strand:+ start:940 stop:1113 length:174 start_codon:yes stop_codon:yes gene_type:complete